MNAIRTIVTIFLVVVLVGLGTACTGAEGEQGPQGDPGADGVGIQNVVSNANGTITISLTNGHTYTTGDLTGPAGATGATGARGAQGTQGVPGPNMVVAMGNISASGSITLGYQVASVTWEASAYNITLIGRAFDYPNYVTLVTPVDSNRHASYGSDASHRLVVVIQDDAGNPVQGYFSFEVLDPTP